MNKKNPILKIDGLRKEFKVHRNNQSICACENISLDVNEGEFMGITGRSGSGKSTILKGIYRTNYPQEGSILYQSSHFGEIDLCKVSERQIIFLRKYEIGYVSQFLKFLPRTTALEIIEAAVLEMGYPSEVSKKKAIEMLRHFELDESLWNIYPNTFSGGEKLRLNIAAAMVKKPRLLLLDEPTASLDKKSKLKVKKIIHQLKEEGTTMLGIFHDLEFMDDVCDCTYDMEQGV